MEIYNNLITYKYTPEKVLVESNINDSVKKNLKIVGDKIQNQKGVYTVIITLSIHKILNPSQDIRYHQKELKNGFSGRSVDTKYITPTLKKLNLTSMSESGWLTRSLEQPYPYTKDYNGKISNKNVRNSFLEITDFIQKSVDNSIIVVKYLLSESIKIRELHNIILEPLKNPERISIDNIILSLDDLFNNNYKTSGGSKLPVITYFTIYQLLTNEIGRYNNYTLDELGYHTTSDRTSKSSGDIEVKDSDGNLFESLEIKYDVEIDSHIVRRVETKIYKYNPKRYYILSSGGIKPEDYDEIQNLIIKIKNEHGCQLIINGLIPTIKYYLRLLKNLDEFIFQLSKNIFKDKELKVTHKNYWKKVYNTLNKWNTGNY